MFGIEKDFQNLMEQVYGPLGKKEQEECDRIAKQLVDNAIEEVKKTTEIDPSRILKDNDCIWYMGEKYQKVQEPQSFYDKLWGLLRTKIDNPVECSEMADRVSDLIREHIPEPIKNKHMSEYLFGYNEAIKEVKKRLFNGIQ